MKLAGTEGLKNTALLLSGSKYCSAAAARGFFNFFLRRKGGSS